MLTFAPFFKHKIARRLVVYILIFSSIVTLGLTLVQLYKEYTHDISLIESRIHQTLETNKAVLEENIWLLNNQSIELLTEGILSDRDIVYLEIRDDNNAVLVSKGHMPESDFRQIETELEYSVQQINYQLGRVKIVATLEFVYQRLIETALVILVNQAVQIFLVSIFIIALVGSLITRHLESISNFVGSIDLHDRPEEFKLERIDNHWTKSDELTNVVNSLNLMRQELFQSYNDIEHQSLHDHLTGLPNRQLLEQRLHYELLQSGRRKQFGALMFIDLDNFKMLNDSLGHSAGDEFLRIVSRRFEKAVRKGDTLARVGGDEFLVLLGMLSTDADQAGRDAYKVAEKIQQLLNEKIELDKHQYRVTASIGIEIFSGDLEDYESILKHADNAMYQAKADGRGTIRMYHSKMQEVADHRLSTERRLVNAISNHEFELYYQPKYDLNRQIVSAEALIRWLGPNGEIISPATFIGIAEESGLIIPIGEEVLKMAFRFAQTNISLIQRAGIKNIAINVSPRQFTDANFIKLITSEVERFKLDASLFTLEITEEAVVRNIDKTIEYMNILKRHGFKISIDDFGTGYSSLRHLKEFPLDELKIDQSFVNQIVEYKEDEAIVSSIIWMAQSLNLDVVAEGVETEQQLDLLIKNGCRTFQGYLFSRPVESQTFISNLEQQVKSQIHVV